MTDLKPPEKLGPAGKKLWEEVTEAYDLLPDQARVLGSACALADTIETMTFALKGQPLTVLGSARQTVAHPLLAEIRQSRATQATLLKQLDLRHPPDDDEEEQRERMTRSESGRYAASRRWNRH